MTQKAMRDCISVASVGGMRATSSDTVQLGFSEKRDINVAYGDRRIKSYHKQELMNQMACT